MKILVTGGASFIGSAVLRHIINSTDHLSLNIDKLTYAGNLESFKAIDQNERYHKHCRNRYAFRGESLILVKLE